MIAALVLLAELGVRVAEPRLSLDVDHLRQIPRLLTAMHASPAPTVLFLGNSLTRRGVDLAHIEEVLNAVGVAPEAVAAVYPDDTTMLDWLYLHQDAIARRSLNPSVIVLGFALRHLEDEVPRPVQTYRLGRHFTSWAALPELFATDIPRLSDRVNVVMSKVSVMYASRERISRRLMAYLPGYEPMADRINTTLLGGNRANAGAPTYARLERLLVRAAEQGTKVIVVAMPVRSPYDVAPALPELLATHGAMFVDARAVEGLDASHFVDGLHLSPRGAQLYSAYMAAILAGYITER